MASPNGRHIEIRLPWSNDTSSVQVIVNDGGNGLDFVGWSSMWVKRYLIRHTVLGGIAISCWAGGAMAQDICVECSGPAARYNCSIKDAGRVQNVRGSGRAFEFVCLTELARAGKHDSCRISTGFTGACIGEPREIDVTKTGDDVVVGGTPQPSPAVGTGVPPPAPGVGEAKKKGPPETLEQLARETVAQSKQQLSEADEGLKKAGEAVGGALKKSWSCLTTLFKECSNAEAEPAKN